MENKQTSKKSEPLVKCTVIESGTKIGSMTLAKGKLISIPKSIATELESLNKVKIDGVTIPK